MPAFFSRRSILVIPGLRARPAVITTTSEPRRDEKSVEPLTSTSTPVSAIFWEMSMASPSARPGTMSTRVTSSIPADATSSAACAPTLPAPRKPIMSVFATAPSGTSTRGQ